MSVTLRVACTQDAPALLAIYAPYVRNTFITFEYDVPDVAEFAERISATLQRYPYIVACGEDGTPLGYAYLGVFHAREAYDWTAESSIYVEGAARGMHVGTLLHEALERAARLQGLTNLEACIAYPDEGGSVGFHERMGYRMVGRFEACGYKLGAWRDMVWMEKHIAPHSETPAPVALFPQVQAQVEQMLKELSR